MRANIGSAAVTVIILAAVAGVIISGWGSEPETAAIAPYADTGLFQSLREAVAAEKRAAYVSEIDFDALHEINPDIFAWITVPETNIDYPILWTDEEEDDYYLYHTPEGEADVRGSIYMEKYTAKDFSDPLTILYGHTLMDGTMFSELHKYEDKAFFDANPYFYIYLPEAKLTYRVFAAVAFDDRHLYWNYDLYQPTGFRAFMADVKGCVDGEIAGNFNSEVSVKRKDKILVLSTCIDAYDEYPEQRWIVCAVLADG